MSWLIFVGSYLVFVGTLLTAIGITKSCYMPDKGFSPLSISDEMAAQYRPVFGKLIGTNISGDEQHDEVWSVVWVKR